MSRRPVSIRAVLQLVAGVLTVVLVVTVLGYLHRTSPRLADDFLVEGTEDQRGPNGEFLECERRLPGRQQVEFGTGTEPAVGRLRSSEVVACPDQFDGRLVEFVGEVVGDVLERQEGAWVLVNDDAYALESGPLPAHDERVGTNTGLTVWLPGNDVEAEVTPGRPRLRGDVIAVRGRLLRADPADGGGMTLRAEEYTVVSEARPAEPPFRRTQAIVAAIVVLVTLAVVGYERRYHQA